MDKYFMWIHYERLHNHNKAKHNKTVCIFLGIYCKGTNTDGYEHYRQAPNHNTIQHSSKWVYCSWDFSRLCHHCFTLWLVTYSSQYRVYLLRYAQASLLFWGYMSTRFGKLYIWISTEHFHKNSFRIIDFLRVESAMQLTASHRPPVAPFIVIILLKWRHGLLITRTVIIRAQLLINTSMPKQDGRHFADKIFKCIFLNGSCCILSTSHWNMFAMAQLTMIQNWSRFLLGAKQATSHYLKQWELNLLTHICVSRPQQIY